MGRPKNTNIRVNLSADNQTITIEVRSSNPQLALQLYEKLESLLLEAMRVDLEADWQDDNSDQK